MTEKKDEPTALIALLDQLLLAKGSTIASYLSDTRPAIDHAASMIQTTPPNVPPSLAVCPNVTLSDELMALDQDIAKRRQLEARIAGICLDPAVITAAHTLVIAEATAHYITLQNDLPLPRLLATLRTQQQLARHAFDETFAIRAVCGIKADGLPVELATYYLDTSISWKGLQQALCDMTKGWRARAAGLLHGYSLNDSKWMYQVSGDGSLSTTLHDLSSEAEFRAMRRTFTSDPRANVLVWHERIWEASRLARAECEALRDVRSFQEGGDPLNEDGTPMFDAYFEPDPNIEWNMEMIGRVDSVQASRAPSADLFDDQVARVTAVDGSAADDDDGEKAEGVRKGGRPKPQSRKGVRTSPRKK